jgi:hypothetical protein
MSKKPNIESGRAKGRKSEKPISPTGIASIDALVDKPTVSIDDYVVAVSEYVRRSRELSPGPKKAGQIRLSNGLARALAGELKARLPAMGQVDVGEHKVSGALRTVNADVSEPHRLDGLRLAVELKPVNLAVGRAIWNRFGDIRTFAVNLHLKFPFCVVGGVLVIPIWEEVGSKEAQAAEVVEEAVADLGDEAIEIVIDNQATALEVKPEPIRRKDTRQLIERAVTRLVRAGGRKTEADGAHLLEGIAVVVYDPDNGEVDRDLPPAGSGLRWNEFVDSIVSAYEARFES